MFTHRELGIEYSTPALFGHAFTPELRVRDLSGRWLSASPASPASRAVAHALLTEKRAFGSSEARSISRPVVWPVYATNPATSARAPALRSDSPLATIYVAWTAHRETCPACLKTDWYEHDDHKQRCEAGSRLFARWTWTAQHTSKTQPEELAA